MNSMKKCSIWDWLNFTSSNFKYLIPVCLRYSFSNLSFVRAEHLENQLQKFMKNRDHFKEAYIKIKEFFESKQE